MHQTQARILATETSTVFSDLETKSWVTHHRDYLPRDEAGALFAWMQENTPWQVEAPIIMGKPREARRRTCAYGVPGLSYRYSGLDRVALAWPDIVRPLLGRLNDDFGVAFNFALCQLYPDGQAGIGTHADDERDLVKNSPIVGLSLGATRDFILENRKGERAAAVTLEHGSAVVMWGATQRHYRHSVPPRKRVKTPRVSLTFRVMAGARA